MDAEAHGEGETLARHKATLSALAARFGHVVAHWYPEVTSGETISARPEMQRLLSAVSSGGIAGVYVMEVERLARGDTMDQGLVARTFMLSHTKIITPLKVYDPTNEFDEEYFEFSLFMSRREYKTINRRIQAGRMHSLREGKYIGSRPAYGYEKVKIPNDKGYTLAVIPDEAKVVTQIFNWYLYGDHGQDMGLTRIANRLIDMRVPYGQQGGTWKPCRIYRILTNEVYIGMIRWGRVKSVKKLAGLEVEKNRTMTADYDLFPGLHPAIIDNETFEAVQKKLPCSYTPLQVGKQLSNPLAGLVLCAGCGHTLRGKPAAGRQPAMLFCATHGCGVVRTARQDVEEAILSILRDWLITYEATPDGAPVATPEIDESSVILQTSLEALKQEQQTLHSQVGRLHDFLERGIYTPTVFAERMTDLNTRLKTIDESIAHLRQQLADLKPQQQALRLLAPQIRHVLDVYDATTSAQEKNDLLKSVISKIDYNKAVKGNQHIDPHQFQIVVWPKLL